MIARNEFCCLSTKLTLKEFGRIGCREFYIDERLRPCHMIFIDGTFSTGSQPTVLSLSLMKVVEYNRNVGKHFYCT